MMSNEMINNLSKISSRWTKGDMDRLYINIDDANDLYMSIEDREHGQLTLNRRERSTGKIWIDVASGEISTKGISDADEVASEIAELIAFLCPAEDTETAEETETESINYWYAAQKDTEDDWGTGSYDLDEAKAIARSYRANGYANALVAVIDEKCSVCVDEINDID